MLKKIGLTKDIKNIHFRGIGGVSMSGIATTLNLMGYNITGSDDNESLQTLHLKKNGIPVVIGVDLENLKKADLLIYTNSMSDNDEELVMAKEHNIPKIERAEALGLITKDYKHSIAIAGTNGKTTTTAMVSSIFLRAKKDPSIQIGALFKNINSNYRIGKSETIIFEACEFRESFLNFEHETAVILNIDYDHLDYFKDFNHIKEAFFKFAKASKNNQNIILNYDDKSTEEIIYRLQDPNDNVFDCVINDIKLFNILTFGINEKADVYAKNIQYVDGKLKYDLFYNNKFLTEIELNVLGDFNVSNSLAAITVALAYKIDINDIKLGLLDFYGANRRFEYRGQINGAAVYDDYAHNPTKVAGLLTAVKPLNKKTWLIFEPHTYSRTKELFDDFVESLKDYDNIILTKIYAAREKNTYKIYSEDLVNALNNKYNKKALYIEEYSDIIKYLKKNVNKDDLVLFVGAGSINKLFDYV